MKSVVTKNLLCWFLLIALCGQPLYASCAENSCDCQEPPGGRIQCGGHQVAICRVKDGKVYGECKDIPSFNASVERGPAVKGPAVLEPTGPEARSLRREAWILSEILQTTIRPEEVKRQPEYQRILKEGKYTNPRTGEVIRFRLPRN